MSLWPLVTRFIPSVTVILRSACNVSVSVSVALLLLSLLSVTPLCSVTVAVFDIDPLAAVGGIVPLSLHDALPIYSIVTVSLILPLPLAVNPEAPPVCVAVKLMPVKTAGKLSLTGAPVTLPGPLLVTTIVYVSAVPELTVPFPSVTVTLRSACKVSVSVSVALLLVRLLSVTPLGAVTVAVSESDPLGADGLIVPVAV